MPDLTPQYCPLCATALQLREEHGHRRPACPNCHFIHFADPKVAVGVLVSDQAGRLLYTKRAHQPAMGRWAFPSGFVDRGEEVRVAARRELREETGLEVELDALLGVYSREGDPVVFIVFAGHPCGGALEAGSEAFEVAFFAAEELPPPAFPFDAEILTAWREWRGS